MLVAKENAADLTALSELIASGLLVEAGTEIVKGVDLEVDTDQIHAIMGPNGSGKSTLAYSVAGHPKYDVTGGTVTLDGDDLGRGLGLAEVGGDEVAGAYRPAHCPVAAQRPAVPATSQGKLVTANNSAER